MILRKGTKVSWPWSGRTATGKITQIFTQDVQLQLKGTTVRRKASRDAPAYLIAQDDGDQVLKGRAELSRAD